MQQEQEKMIESVEQVLKEVAGLSPGEAPLPEVIELAKEIVRRINERFNRCSLPVQEGSKSFLQSS